MGMKILSIGVLLILSLLIASAEVDMDRARSHAVARGDGEGTESGVSADTLTFTDAMVDDEGEANALAGSTVEVINPEASINTHGIANSMTMTIENPAVTVEISNSVANSNTLAKADDDGYSAGGNLVYAGTEIGDAGTDAFANTYAEADGTDGRTVSVDHDHMVSHENTITHNS